MTSKLKQRQHNSMKRISKLPTVQKLSSHEDLKEHKTIQRHRNRNLNFMVTWFTNLRNLNELMIFLFSSEKS